MEENRDKVILSVDSGIHLHDVHNVKLQSFSSLDIIKILDIQKERFRDWHSRKFVVASQESTKQGKKALFSRLDVYGVGLFKEFVEKFRLAREEAAQLTELWRKKATERDNLKTGGYFKIICFFRRDEEVSIKPAEVIGNREIRFERNENWDFIICINVARIIAKIDEAMAQ